MSSIQQYKDYNKRLKGQIKILKDDIVSLILINKNLTEGLLKLQREQPKRPKIDLTTTQFYIVGFLVYLMGFITATIFLNSIF